MKYFQYFPVQFTNQFEDEESPQMNYKLMAEASNLSQIIKEQTAAIEENMRFGGLSDSPKKKQIDMNLIEQIKQRRKD